MGAVIACYSFSGKTRGLCEALADMTGIPLEHVIETQKRSVLSAYLSGSRQAMAGRRSEIKDISGALGAADTVCLAGPIWAGHAAPALNAVIDSGALAGKQVLCILTCANSARGAADALRERLAGADAQCAGVQVLRKADITSDRLGKMADWLRQLTRDSGEQ